MRVSGRHVCCKQPRSTRNSVTNGVSVDRRPLGSGRESLTRWLAENVLQKSREIPVHENPGTLEQQRNGTGRLLLAVILLNYLHERSSIGAGGYGILLRLGFAVAGGGRR